MPFNLIYTILTPTSSNEIFFRLSYQSFQLGTSDPSESHDLVLSLCNTIQSSRLCGVIVTKYLILT